MTIFRLWAPNASQVELQLGDQQRLAMQPGADGQWSLDVSSAGPGTDYAFILDGQSPALPDPRSPWQPQGVHGPSRVVDHSAYIWHDLGWRPPPISSAVIYELHVGTFSASGDFLGVIDHLDHLLDLGVTHIELLPVVEFSGQHGWGYDGVDLFAPHHAYGGPEALKQMVDACHQRGLAVILDVVYNHLGPEGNYLERFGPYFTEKYHTPWGKAINFDDRGSDQVRRFMIDNALYWLREYHIDALRLDATQNLSDSSATHIMEEMAAEVRRLESQLGRDLALIAESDLNDPRLITAPEAGGYGLDAQWSDDFHHALHTALTGENGGYYADFHGLPDLATTLRQAYLYTGQYASTRGRRHGRMPINIPAARFLVYLQSHDQVGNQVQGQRISHLVGTERAKIGAALVLLSPFIPMLFQGEEWGASSPFRYFTAHEDPELGRLVSEGRRKELSGSGWEPEQVPDPQAEETFLRSKLNWEEISQPPHSELFEWHRALIGLRRSYPELAHPSFEDLEVRVDSGVGWLSMRRGSITLLVNLSPQGQTVGLRIPPDSQVLLASQSGWEMQPHSILLPPDSAVVLGPLA